MNISGFLAFNPKKKIRGKTKVKYTFDDYCKALEGAGPKLKELVLARAAHDRNIDFMQLSELVAFAYPGT